MKKITQNAINAFLAKSYFSQSNTQVRIGGGIQGANISELFLFGNKIAIKDFDSGTIYISMARWGSVTTRERLSGLPSISIGQRNWDQYLYINNDLNNGILLDPCKWYSIDTQLNVKELRSAPFFPKV